MRILCYNVCEGVLEPGREEKLARFINKQTPDLVGLLELNTWDEGRIARFKTKIGMPYHSFLEAKTGYHLGLFSKEPLQSKTLTEGLWHGAIIADLEEFEIVLTHLCPKTEDFRLKELDVLLEATNPDKETLLIGDLNSLSPDDHYDQELIKRFNEIGLRKFGTDNLRFDVINEAQKTFIDMTRMLQQRFTATVPTSFNQDQSHAAPLRLDYCMATPIIARNIKRAETIITDETDRLSDHFPLLIELDEKERLRIGIDMDGVLADTNPLKIAYVKEHHKLDVDDSQVSKAKLSKIIGMDAYKEMIANIYVGDKLLSAPSVKGAKEAMEALCKEHHVIVITNRSDEELATAERWLKKENTPYHSIRNTSGTGKDQTCKDYRIDVLLDDNIKELTGVHNEFTQKTLLIRPYNEDADPKKEYWHAYDWETFTRSILEP